MTHVVLTAGARTPFGDFGKSLKDVPLSALGAHAVRACIERSGAKAHQIEHLAFGNVLPVDKDGNFISRKVALEAGLPIESSAVTVNRACASGSEAIAAIARMVMSGESKIGVAAGGENFSRASFMVDGIRWGHPRGPAALEDGLDRVYRCPFGRELMGETAEAVVTRYGYQREELDAYALESQLRAKAATENGWLAKQIAPITLKEKAGDRVFSQDEYPRFGTTAAKLASLKPAFRAGGVVTAGNSSGVTDGAAAVLIADEEAAIRADIQPVARVVAFATAGVPPEIMGIGPVPAIRKLLDGCGLSVDDIDYFEINEAFAVVNVHVQKELGIPMNRTNLYGGGISIGHPPGATGIRMTLTAMHHLADTKARYAVISMCVGGGQGMATLIERV